MVLNQWSVCFCHLKTIWLLCSVFPSVFRFSQWFCAVEGLIIDVNVSVGWSLWRMHFRSPLINFSWFYLKQLVYFIYLTAYYTNLIIADQRTSSRTGTLDCEQQGWSDWFGKLQAELQELTVVYHQRVWVSLWLDFVDLLKTWLKVQKVWTRWLRIINMTEPSEPYCEG